MTEICQLRSQKEMYRFGSVFWDLCRNSSEQLAETAIKLFSEKKRVDD